MAIPSTGAISLNTIQTEFGGCNPISINEYYAGGSYVPSCTSGTNGAVPQNGQISFSQFYGTSDVVTGQAAYVSAGCFSWVAPACVTSVSVLAIGGGAVSRGLTTDAAGGGGGALAFKNNISVTPGSSYQVSVGRVGNRNCVYSGTQKGLSSFFQTQAQVGAGGAGQCQPSYASGGKVFSGTGYKGGMGQPCTSPYGNNGYGGGGAGGYGGPGGRGGFGGTFGYPYGNNGNAGSGGGGGGGSGGYYFIPGPCYCTVYVGSGGRGGGVGLLGQSNCGAAGVGGAGGGGGDGSVNVAPGQQAYGYGGGGTGAFYSPNNPGGYQYCGGPGGGGGAVRIMWPGTTRTYPATCAGDK